MSMIILCHPREDGDLGRLDPDSVGMTICVKTCELLQDFLLVDINCINYYNYYSL